MFKKRNILIGITGMIGSTLFLIVFYTKLKPDSLLSRAGALIMIPMGIYFMGVIIAGWQGGLSCALPIFLYFLILLLPENIRFPFLVAYFLLSFFGLRLWEWWENRRASQNDGSRQGEEKRAPIPQIIFEEAIYLVTNIPWKFDNTYKVTPLGDTLYFCRVGGPYHDIDVTIAQNNHMTAEQLLAHPKSFSIPLSAIHRVTVSSKRREWAGIFGGNGSVFLSQEGKREQEFIIHSINACPKVEQFFSHILSTPVQTISEKYRMGKKQKERGEKRL